MTPQVSGNDLVFYQDTAGHYWVQAAGMDQPVPVPDERTQEVEAVIAGQVGDVAGFLFTPLPTVPPSTVSVAGAQLTAIGRGNGAGGHTFGVLGTQFYRGPRGGSLLSRASHF